MTATAHRLVVLFEHDTPDNSVLEFYNAAEVEDKYGFDSHEAGIARTFFINNPTGTLSFIREGLGQRSHLIGANISSEPMAMIRRINGPLTITFNGRTYGSTIDLSSAQNLSDVKRLLTAELNANPQVMATTAGSRIRPVTVHFTGYFDRAQLTVMSVQPGKSLKIGGDIWGDGVTAKPPTNQLIYQHYGALLGGPGDYSCFGRIGDVTTPEPMTETYGVLDTGGTTSGKVAIGEEVTGPGIPKNTAVISRLSDHEWLINNAVDIPHGETLTFLETPLQVGGKQYVGATETNDFFMISPDGAYGYDANPSTMSYAQGSAAYLLGLAQWSPVDPITGIGADLSSPGGQHPSIPTFMDNILLNDTNQFGQPVTFNQLQTNDYKLTPELESWAQDHGIKFIQHPPVG